MNVAASDLRPSRDTRHTADDLAPALEALSAPGDRPVLVDFDHTLFASNSTELFLASARPAFLVSLLLGLVRGAIAWRLYSPRWVRPRDYLTVIAVIVLMPWNLLAWRRRGPALFRRHTTHVLADALRQIPPERITIVSFGIAPLIRPLLRGSPWGPCRLVSMDVPCNRQSLVSGKAALLRQSLPSLDPAQAIVITDSEDDRDLLDAAGVPVLIPRQGDAVLADSRFYLPWRYASLGKYDRSYVVDQAVFVDLALAVLATGVALLGSPWLLVGMLSLYVSLHAVYEIGYFENDFRAARFEANPTLASGAEMFRGFPLPTQAWQWSLALGVLGCAAVNAGGGAPFATLLASWVAVLVATRLVFHLYNRQPEGRRLLLYPFLQAAKSFGLLAIFPACALGVALLSAQVVMMWMNYAVYRLGGQNRRLPREEVRLAAFVVFGLGIALTGPTALVEAGPLAASAMLAWAVWRSLRGRLRRMRSAFAIAR